MATITSAELAEFAAYERLNGPIGTAHDDRLTEYLALVVASTVPTKRKVKPKDFRIDWDRHRKLTQSELEAKIYRTFGPKPRSE